MGLSESLESGEAAGAGKPFRSGACCPLAKNPEVTRQILISNYDDVKSETLRPYEAVAFYERERADENI